MNMMDIRRRMLESMASGVSVTSVSTAAHTGVSISSLTWDEISAYSKAISRDSANTYSDSILSVTFSDGMTLGAGDYLNISISGVNYRVDLIGFHHDTVTNSAAYGGTYAGITWLMHNVYGTKYAMSTLANNSEGWTNCQMRTTRMVSFLGGLTSDVSSVIVPVDKLTSAGNESLTIVTTSDSLFLLSEIEIAGSLNFSATGEGTKYAYFSTISDRRKYLDTTLSFWLERSPAKSSVSYWCAINITGAGGLSNINTDNPSGVAFAFCT